MLRLDQSKSEVGMPDGRQQVASLAGRARDGERAAFEELVNLFHEEIFRMVYYRTQSRMDAEDLTQDIFLLGYKNLSKLQDLDRFRPWLFTIAVNRVKDFLRKRRFLAFFGFSTEEGEPDPYETEPDSRPGALDQLIEHEFWERVKQLAGKFSPMEREVFFLRFMDHLSLKEIAQVLDKSESAVKTHLYRALKKFKEDPALREILQGDTHEQ